MWRSMNIFNKILWSLSLLVLGYSLTIAYGFFMAMHNNACIMRLSAVEFPASQLSQKASSMFDEQIKLYQDMVATGDVYILSNAEKKALELQKILEELENTITDNNLKNRINETLEHLHLFNASAPWVYKEMRKPSYDYNPAIMERAKKLADQRTNIQKDLTYYKDYFAKSLNMELARIAASIKSQGIMNLWIFLLATCASLFFVIYMIMRSIKAPLQNMIDAFSTGAMGDFSTRLDASSGDELGRLAHFFNMFMEKLEIYNRDLHEEIEERKRSEEALRTSEELYTKLVNTIPEAVVRTDLNGNVLFVNDYAIESTLYSREELVGQNIFILLSPDYIEKAKKNRDLMLNGHHQINSYVMLQKNGDSRYVEVNGDVLRSEDGIANGIVYAIRDVTERKQAETENAKLQKQLVQAQKMESIGRLAGGVAHDFNNMLSVIIGNAEMAMEDMVLTDPVLKTLTDIHNAAERSADLTRQLLAFARKQTIDPKVLDLNLVIKNMFKMLQRLIGEDIQLVLAEPSELWKVKMDPSQIDQILANLVVNARDAIHDKGIINISLKNTVTDELYCGSRPDCQPGEYVVISVSDNGDGMDKTTLSNIFEPFFTTKKEGHGTGLGLATVYGIVRQNGGFINVYSEEGQGTTFKIHLPRTVEEAIHVTKHSNIDQIQGGQETILVVEDEQRVLSLSKEMLEKMGYHVLTASTSSEALQKAKEFADTIDLLLTDVVMPEMNGRELARKIDMFRPGLRCLYMSGYTSDVIAHHGILEQGVHFISKPFTMKGLADKVRVVLDS